MVQINLLPDVTKKKQRIKVELKLALGPIVFFLFALLLTIIAVWTMLGMQLSGKQKELSKLDEQLKTLKFTLEKQDELRKDKERLLRKAEFADRHLKRKVLWAKNLNRLSNLLPAGIWLKNVVLHTKKAGRLNIYKKLDISGSAASLQSEEMIASIGAFMTALKKDEVFSEQFSEIKLLSSQRSKAGEIEIMDFKLSATFTEVE